MIVDDWSQARIIEYPPSEIYVSWELVPSA